MDIDTDLIKSGFNQCAEVAVITGIGCLLGRVVSNASQSLKFNMSNVAASTVLFLLIDRLAQLLIRNAVDEDKTPVNPPIAALRSAGACSVASFAVNFLANRFGLPKEPLLPLIALILSANVIYSLFSIGYAASRAIEKDES